MHTLLPRILGSLAGGIVAWFALFLKTHLDITMTQDEANALIGALVFIGMLLYGVIHRKVSQKLNPMDTVVATKYEPGSVDTLDNLMREVVAWADATFPHATSQSRANHLLREAKELVDSPDDAEEQADIFFLLAHITRSPQRLASAVRAKLEKNKRRTWGVPDADGVVEHISEGTFSTPHPTEAHD